MRSREAQRSILAGGTTKQAWTSATMVSKEFYRTGFMAQVSRTFRLGQSWQARVLPNTQQRDNIGLRDPITRCMPDDTFRSTRPLWLFEHGQRKQANGSMLDTRPTMRNVSRIAGVSLGTASNVFANRALVDKDLCGRITSASPLLSYQPIDVATSRRTSRTQDISIPDLAVLCVVNMLQERESAAEVDVAHGV